MKLPNARTTDIIEQDLSKELLIYDLRINKAYTLNETSMKVYRACNSEQTFEDLTHNYKYTDEIIYLALDGLQKENLLAGEYTSPFDGMNRREVIKKVGLATMIALPLITG